LLGRRPLATIVGLVSSARCSSTGSVAGTARAAGVNAGERRMSSLQLCAG
jgi:hypothetical protein